MMALVVRIVMFLAAILVTANVLLPNRQERVRVDGHSTSESHERSAHQGDRTSIDYRLRFAGGSIGSCSVGYSAYNALKDGDEVLVSTTRVFKSCTRITRDGEAIIPTGGRWAGLALAAFLFAGAFGWSGLDRWFGDADAPLRRGRWWLKY
jgi:hypothetical protein